jgi:hypothetical protein
VPTVFSSSNVTDLDDRYSGFLLEFFIDDFTITPDFCEVSYECTQVKKVTDANADLTMTCDDFDKFGNIGGRPFGQNKLEITVTADDYTSGRFPPGNYDITISGTAT